MAASGTDINYQGASSNVNFDDNGDVQSATYEIFSFAEDGSVKTVDTVEYSG